MYIFIYYREKVVEFALANDLQINLANNLEDIEDNIEYYNDILKVLSTANIIFYTINFAFSGIVIFKEEFNYQIILCYTTYSYLSINLIYKTALYSNNNLMTEIIS